MLEKCKNTIILFLIFFFCFTQTKTIKAIENDTNKNEVPFSTNEKNITIWNGENYIPFFIKGINLGVAIPGTFPGELAASKEQYAKWLEEINDVGFNCIRLYTLHYPRFYEALNDFNQANPTNPMYVMHGVWLSEEKDGYTKNLKELDELFDTEIKDIIDCVHGNKSIEHRFGKAYGTYSVDVSKWIMTYIIGREVHPAEIAETNNQNSSETSFSGEIFKLLSASPSEVWVMNKLEFLVKYEREFYQTERPVSFSSWPTLDPINHPTETDDEDKESLDLANIELANAPAGFFVSYHAYPYYPDFIGEDPKYQKFTDPIGNNSYKGYLNDLKKHYQNIPVLIAEIGTPSSWGIAHYTSNGMHHGGNSEVDQGLNFLRLLDNIKEEDCAGGIQFSWIDEWFKRTWITDPIDYNPEARVNWHNITSAEQNYGLIAFRPEQITYYELENFGEDKPITKIHAASDFDFFTLQLELKNELANIDTIWLAIDTYNAAIGESTLPTGHIITNRAEFALRITNYGAELFVTEAYDLFGIWHKVSTPEQLYHSTTTDGAPWNLVRWKNNSGNHEIQYVGNLSTRRVELSESSLDAVVISNENINIQIPWSLLQFVEPSKLKVINDDRLTEEKEEALSDGIAVSILHNNVLMQATNRYVWPEWNKPEKYVEVKKQSYFITKDGLIDFNNPPIAYADAYTTNQDENLNTTEIDGLLANDFDLDGDEFHAELSEFTENGFVFLQENGAFEYVPNTGYSGSDSFTYRAFDEKGHSVKTSVHITIDAVTDIEEIENSSLSASVYPNPASTFLKIDLPKVEKLDLQLINLQGQTVYSKEIHDSKYIINVNRYPKGVYLLRIKSKTKLTSKKIILF